MRKQTKQTKQTKWVLLTMMLILVLSMTGCEFSIGTDNNTIMGKDFHEIFDRETESGGYKVSMVKYDVTTEKYGKMVVVLDTSEGHSFKMDESGDFFTIFDKDGAEVIKTNFYHPDDYKRDTAPLTDIETINYRDFFVGEYLDGYYAMSYMADCGLDLGIFMQAKDMDSFKLIAFGGEPLEGSSSDIHFYQGEAETAETADTAETKPEAETKAAAENNAMTFENGKSFVVNDYTISPYDDYVYKIADKNEFIEVHAYENTDADEITENLRKVITSEDVTPVVDYHSEGNYITGIYNDQLVCGFISADKEGTVYAVILYTQDQDNCITIANSLVDDLLAADFMGGDVRTEYGEPVNEDGDGDSAKTEDEDGDSAKTEDEDTAKAADGKYYTVPSDYKCDYTCEFFDTYSNNDISITFNFEVDSEIEDFLSEGDDAYYDMYELSLVTTVATKKGNVSIVKAYDKEADYTRYYGMSDDKSVNFYFSIYQNDDWSTEDFENFVKKFIP